MFSPRVNSLLCSALCRDSTLPPVWGTGAGVKHTQQLLGVERLLHFQLGY